MTFNEYQEQAMLFASDVSSATDENLMLQGVMGMAGESGEAVDLVKKYFFHGHSLDKEHLAKEIGDVLWYCATCAKAIGYSFDEIAEMNKSKLENRYGEKFSTAKSIHRKAGDI